MKNMLLFLLGFVIVAVPMIAFCGTVTEVWQEKYSRIDIAFIEDDELKAIPGFESIFQGFMPRNVIKIPVKIHSDSEQYSQLLKGRIYEL